MAEPQKEAQPQVCAHCQNPLVRGCYEIKRIKPDGTAAPKEIRVCSVLCLLQWAYSYGVRRGLQGFAMVQDLLSKIKGPKGSGTAT